MNDNNKQNKDLQENVNKIDDENKNISETNEINYVGLFLPIGTGLGVSLGIAFKNLAMGISIGTALGILIGAIVESRKKKK